MNDPQKQAEYIECYNLFEKQMVEHIPNKLPNNMIGYGWASPKYLDETSKYAGIYLSTRINSELEYLDLKKQSTKNAKYIGKSTDKCFVIIRNYGILSDNDIDENCKK